MPLDRATVEAYVAKLNAQRRPHEAVALESFEEPGRFVLSFPNRPLPEGRCIDEDFTQIQFALFEERDVSTNLVGGRHDEADDRYRMTYEVVEWD